MTTSFVGEASRPIGIVRVNTAHRPRVGSERLGRNARRNRAGLIAFLTRLSGGAGTQTNKDFLAASFFPGVIGGAVIRAARKSARISRRKLARLLTTSPRTVRSWENGTCPLFLVSYDGLGRLADALDRAGAKVQCGVTELMLAAQCDLLIAGMLRGFEDYAEVPPVDEDSAEGQAAYGLLRWAFTGLPPERYRTSAPVRPLLPTHDLNAFTALALQLSTGSHGKPLVSYGRALVAITTRRLG
jgi:transcriptional regulator with XRE-family HTH domain